MDAPLDNQRQDIREISSRLRRKSLPQCVRVIFKLKGDISTHLHPRVPVLMPHRDELSAATAVRV